MYVRIYEILYIHRFNIEKYTTLLLGIIALTVYKIESHKYIYTVYCKKNTQTKEWSDGHMLLSLPYLRTFLQRIVIISIDFFHGYVD